MILTAEVKSVSPFKIQFEGEESISDRVYPRLSSYTPVLGDRVIFLNMGNLYICLGKLV